MPLHGVISSSFNPFKFVCSLGACSLGALNLTLFLFLGIVYFKTIGYPHFNYGLGSLATLYFNFPLEFQSMLGYLQLVYVIL